MQGGKCLYLVVVRDKNAEDQKLTVKKKIFFKKLTKVKSVANMS